MATSTNELKKMNKGIPTLTYELSPLQAALIEWGKQHPYGRIKELTFQDGVPIKAEVYCPDNTGTETVLFDVFAKLAKLLD